MVRSHSRYITTTLPSGNLLVADAGSLPQDLFLVTPGEFSKTCTEPVTQELNSEKLLKRRISLSPDLEFHIERLSVSQCSNICAVGRHCLAILQPIGDLHGCREIDSFIFRSFPVCRYTFHPKSTLELVHVTFVSAEREFLSVLSTDCTLRLFESSHLSPENLLAPFRTINLLYPQRNIGVFPSKRITAPSASSRISLAKCEPFVSVAFLNEASVMAALEIPSRIENIECSQTEVFSWLPFIALRSNGDVYFGFVDMSAQPTVCSPSPGSEKGAYDCQLAGPLKIQIPECGSADDGTRFCDLNACAMQLVSGTNVAKGVPLVIIVSADGSISHYLLMTETDFTEKHTTLNSMFAPSGTSFNAKSSLTLHFPPSALFAVERLQIACSPHTSHPTPSLTSWLYDPSCLRISLCPYDGTFSYFATASSSVFRVSLPWLEAPPTVSDSAFVARIADDPTFVESLLSLDSQTTAESITVAHVAPSNAVLLAAGHSLYTVPTSAKIALSNQQQLLSNVLDYHSPLFTSPSPSLPTSEDVLPPSEDFVAVIQRALARQANLNPKLLSNNIPKSKETGNDDQLSNLYLAATGAVTLLAQEYFGRTDTAARQLTRLQSTCDARLRHVTGTLEKRLSKSYVEFGTNVVPALANRIDNIADRLANLVQRLAKVSELSRDKFAKKSSVLEEACVREGLTNQLADVEVNLAHINALYGEVDEKASYLAGQIATFAERGLSTTSDETASAQQQPPPTSLMPLFETLGGDIRRIADELRHIKEEVERIDSVQARF